MKTTEEPKRIKEILPEGWLPALSRECRTDRSYISGVVNDEKTGSKHWEAVVNLAMKTDPKTTKARLKYLDKITSKATA